MFHHTSTSPIRGMSHARARQFITEIIKKTDYFVVSACGLEHHDKRFMNLANYSETFDDFCTFISMMDAIITVDTSTYHVSDAFDVPTVALFTTINPDFRTRYYPYVESIMLEEKDGQLYGRHKASENEEAKSKEIEYVEEKWANLDVEDVLSALETAKKR
jgi:ADP-heptose:LPS heptosyltransferase